MQRHQFSFDKGTLYTVMFIPIVKDMLDFFCLKVFTCECLLVFLL